MSKELSDWKNKLYFGDNLPIMRTHIPDESVDLIYLDPPFNSQATYNVLFAETNGANSSAQITAFEDTWHWGFEAEGSYREVVQQGGRLADLLQSLRRFLGENDMMAYLVMMAPRLKELHRVLKGTGSVYVHCDDTASHYLKLLMDSIYGPNNYRNQIIWQRTNSHNTAKRYGRVYDVILFYTKTDNYCWNTLKTPYSKEQLKRYRKDDDGRLFTGQDLTASRPNSGSGKFEWRGTIPPQSRGWGYTIEQLEQWWAEGRILTRRDGAPRMDGLKVYLEDMTGKALQSVWTDISRLPNTASERLGYPTQKPEALLERIITASTNEGDVVLDPFCGCGTTVAVAERLKRRWIGIDITYLAISLMMKRLDDTFKGELSPYEIIGDPKDLSGAKALAEQNRFQFEWWVVGKVGAYPAKDKRKGADSGVDGVINFFDDNSGFSKRIVVQVKSGKVQVSQIRDLIGVVKREEAVIGAFITLNQPTEPMKLEAVKEGYYISELLGNDRKFPRIQIITIDDLLAGASIDYPRMADATFKKAQRKFKKTDQQSSIIK